MSTTKIGKFYYVFSGDEAALGNGTGNNNAVDKCSDVSGILELQESITYKTKTYKITKISRKAFYNCSLTGVKLPSSVKVIENCAFDLCAMTQSIDLPESLISVGNWAFSSNKYTSLKIPKNLESIGRGAFHYNNKLTSITVDSSNKHFKTDSQGILYDYNFKTLILSPIINSVEIPDTVTRVRTVAFCCSNFEKIVFPPSVKFIENNIIEHCSNLKTVVVKGNAKFAGDIITASQYETFTYHGTRTVTKEIFKSITPKTIVACTGYLGQLLGQKTFTTDDKCHSYPLERSCRMNSNNKTLQTHILVLILFITY